MVIFMHNGNIKHSMYIYIYIDIDIDIYIYIYTCNYIQNVRIDLRNFSCNPPT